MTKQNLRQSIIALGLTTVLNGCAETWNQADNQGGLFISTTADYIIRNDSGGVIMDVWKLRNVIVSSATQSDGWIFKDEYGNSINLGGDVKMIRLNSENSDLWDRYCDYHVESAGG